MGIFIALYEAKYKGGKRRGRSALRGKPFKWIWTKKTSYNTHRVDGMTFEDVTEGSSDYSVWVTSLRVSNDEFFIHGNIEWFKRKGKGSSDLKEFLVFDGEDTVSSSEVPKAIVKMKGRIEAVLRKKGILSGRLLVNRKSSKGV